MERQDNKEIPKKTFTIRVHHLEIWSHFLGEYEKMFPIWPWQIPKNDGGKMKDFITNYVSKDVDSYANFIRYFEDLASDPESGIVERLEYLYDLMGKDPKDYQNIAKKRKDLFNDFLTICQNGEDQRILLTVHHDRFCNTCAVGNHCIRKEENPPQDDRDIVFLRSLKNMVREGTISAGMLACEGEEVFVTVRALFSRNFYKTLWQDVKNSRNGEWL